MFEIVSLLKLRQSRMNVTNDVNHMTKVRLHDLPRCIALRTGCGPAATASSASAGPMVDGLTDRASAKLQASLSLNGLPCTTTSLS